MITELTGYFAYFTISHYTFTAWLRRELFYVCCFSRLRMKESQADSCNRKYCIVTCGVILCMLGIVLTFLKTWILFVILPLFVLTPNSAIGEYWRKPPMEIPTNVYLFNWTNPEDLRNSSVKPKLEEIGPYKYVLNLEKVNVTWNDNKTVTYRQLRTWYFDENNSPRSINETVTMVNAIKYNTAHVCRYADYWWATALSTLMSTIDPNVDTMTTVDAIINNDNSDFFRNLGKQFGFLMPDMPPFKRSGILGFINESIHSTGVINMATGVDGNFQIYNWNYRNETSLLKDECTRLHVTAGELYSQKVTRDDVEIFYSDVCRRLRLEYEDDDIVDGILGYKYVMGAKTLDNGTLLPETKCYCGDHCIPSGVVNVSSCLYGLPAYASLPHFYVADPFYVNALEGMHPERAKHETYVVVEPTTGMPLKATLRIQFNILVQSIDSITIYNDIPPRYFPLIWIEMEIRLPDNLMSQLKMYLKFPFIYSAVSNLLLAIGICILVTAVVLRIKHFMSVHQNDSRGVQSVVLKPEEVPLQNVEKIM